MIYHIPLFFFYLHAGFKPWIWRWRRNGVTGWNSKSLALWQYISIQNHWDILNFTVHIWRMFCLLKILILLLTTALSRVEGGCLRSWGASTVISQSLDSKTLPCPAIPALQPWASTQGHPGTHHTVITVEREKKRGGLVGGKQKNNSYKKKPRLHNALSNVVPNSRYSETV